MKNVLRISFFILLFSASLVSCSSNEEFKAEFSRNKTSLTMRRGRIKRTALVDLPSALKFNYASDNEEFSLVIVLHGAGSSAGDFRELTGFDSYCDDMNFIFVYPNGILGRWDNINDNVFINDLVAFFSDKYKTANVYLTGFSAGAVKLFEVVESLGSRVQAIAPVSGLLKFREDPTSFPSVNLLHIHSLNDREVPSEGIYEEGFYSVKEELEIFRNLSRTNSARKEVKEIVYETQGHIWNEANTQAIMDFFYNHPEKPSRMKLNIETEGFIFPSKGQLNVSCEITNPDFVDEVNIYAGNSAVFSNQICDTGNSVHKNFLITIPSEGILDLKGELKLKTGERIVSTMNPRILSVTTEDGDASLIPIKIVSARSSSIESKELNEINCIDGKLSTRWSSGWTDDEYIVFEFAETEEVKEMILFWEAASALEYDVYGSTDGNFWNRIQENNNCSGRTEVLKFNPMKAKYVKLVFKKRRTRYGYSLWEVFFLKSIAD